MSIPKICGTRKSPRERDMNEGLFGQDVGPVKKREPGRVSAPSDGLIVEIKFGKCGRSFPDGRICDNPRLPGSCHPAPAGRDSWAFVTPCKNCSDDLQPFLDIQPSWTQCTREDREPLYQFIVENWPLIIQKAIQQGDPSCQQTKKTKSRSP